MQNAADVQIHKKQHVFMLGKARFQLQRIFRETTLYTKLVDLHGTPL